jgi:outer membrane protein assembly factor BamB
LVFGSHDRSIYGVSYGKGGGEIRWRRPTNDLVWCSPAFGPGGAVYVGSDDDHLYALDAKDGNVRWTFTAGPCRTQAGVGPEASRCDVDAVTVAPDGTIYASADGLYALRADGTQKWKFEPAVTHCAGAAAVGPDGTIYIGCRDDGFYALDPASGTVRWEYRAGDDIDSSPAIAPDGSIYVGSDDHKLYAFAPSGALKFALATSGPVRSSPAIAEDGTAYVGSFDGSLYAVRSSGEVAWAYRTADRILSSPLVDAAGVVLVGSEDDRLYAISPDGRLAWSVLLDGDVDSTPVLGPDGTIYVGCDDRALHALR